MLVPDIFFNRYFLSSSPSSIFYIFSCYTTPPYFLGGWVESFLRCFFHQLTGRVNNCGLMLLSYHNSSGFPSNLRAKALLQVQWVPTLPVVRLKRAIYSLIEPLEPLKGPNIVLHTVDIKNNIMVWRYNSLPQHRRATRIGGRVHTSLRELPKPCRISGKIHKLMF